MRRHMTVNACLLLSLAGAMAFALPLASTAEDSVATAEPTVVAAAEEAPVAAWSVLGSNRSPRQKGS